MMSELNEIVRGSSFVLSVHIFISMTAVWAIESQDPDHVVYSETWITQTAGTTKKGLSYEKIWVMGYALPLL